MIRSNPTAIPLRASDVKLLQAEIDKRKQHANPSAAGASASAPPPGAGAKPSAEGTGSAGRAEVGGEAQGQSRETWRSGPGGDRQGRSVNERIGL
ncbi:hypothetical protein IAT38_006890 [Cryptococcus sp. DSM 104549]